MSDKEPLYLWYLDDGELKCEEITEYDVRLKPGTKYAKYYSFIINYNGTYIRRYISVGDVGYVKHERLLSRSSSYDKAYDMFNKYLFIRMLKAQESYNSANNEYKLFKENSVKPMGE